MNTERIAFQSAGAVPPQFRARRAQEEFLRKYDEECRAGKHGDLAKAWLTARDDIAVRDGRDPCTGV